jgi:hypothetical protein
MSSAMRMRTVVKLDPSEHYRMPLLMGPLAILSVVKPVQALHFHGSSLLRYDLSRLLQ